MSQLSFCCRAPFHCDARDIKNHFFCRNQLVRVFLFRYMRKLTITMIIALNDNEIKITFFMLYRLEDEMSDGSRKHWRHRNVPPTKISFFLSPSVHQHPSTRKFLRSSWRKRFHFFPSMTSMDVPSGVSRVNPSRSYWTPTKVIGNR